VLTSTFIHTPGVGLATERSLWEQGATSWATYLEAADRLKVDSHRRYALAETVADSVASLEAGSVDFFARRLPKREHWRALSAFGERIAFVDIETDNGQGGDCVTVIGLSDGFDFYPYVKGDNLGKFARDCQAYDVFVTFNGGPFDIPMIIRRFPSLQPFFASKMHIDLCPLLRRLGLTGGLKRIEEELRIRRIPETEGLCGFDAVRLWRIFERGGRSADDALRLLVAYNREDVVNMKLLLDYAIPRLQEEIGWTTAVAAFPVDSVRCETSSISYNAIPAQLTAAAV